MRSIVTLNYIVYFTDKCPQEERSPAGSVTSSNRSSVRQKIYQCGNKQYHPKY